MIGSEQCKLTLSSDRNTLSCWRMIRRRHWGACPCPVQRGYNSSCRTARLGRVLPSRTAGPGLGDCPAPRGQGTPAVPRRGARARRMSRTAGPGHAGCPGPRGQGSPTVPHRGAGMRLAVPRRGATGRRLCRAMGPRPAGPRSAAAPGCPAPITHSQ